MALRCPRCGSESVRRKRAYHRDPSRGYYVCRDCGRYFVEPVATPGESGVTEETDGAKRIATSAGRTKYRPRTAEEVIRDRGHDPEEVVVLRERATYWDYAWGDGNQIVNESYRVEYVPKSALSDLLGGLQPVTVTFGSPPPRWPRPKSDYEVAVVFGDTHFGYSIGPNGSLVPFHDRRALSVIEQVVAWKRPRQIVHLGDCIDFPVPSRWPSHEKYRRLIQPAIVAFARWMARLRYLAGSDCAIHVIEGNHDVRPRVRARALVDELAELTQVGDDAAPVLSIAHLCGLTSVDMGVTIHGEWPNGRVAIVEDERGRPTLVAKHGDRISRTPGATAARLLRYREESLVFGHTHRREAVEETRGAFGEKPIVRRAESVGCLCHVDGRVPSESDEVNWQQGFGLVYYKPGDGRFTLASYPILSGIACVEGREIVGVEEDETEIVGAVA